MEHVELTDTSPHAAYPVIPWCCCLEIDTARAALTPGHHGGINMGMDQTPVGEAAESSPGSQQCVSKTSLLHPVAFCHCSVSQVCSLSFISNPKPALECWARNQPDKSRPADPRGPFKENTDYFTSNQSFPGQFITCSSLGARLSLSQRGFAAVCSEHVRLSTHLAKPV